MKLKLRIKEKINNMIKRKITLFFYVSYSKLAASVVNRREKI
jgi:hypothetical protein